MSKNDKDTPQLCKDRAEFHARMEMTKSFAAYTELVKAARIALNQYETDLAVELLKRVERMMRGTLGNIGVQMHELGKLLAGKEYSFGMHSENDDAYLAVEVKKADRKKTWEEYEKLEPALLARAQKIASMANELEARDENTPGAWVAYSEPVYYDTDNEEIENLNDCEPEKLSAIQIVIARMED